MTARNQKIPNDVSGDAAPNGRADRQKTGEAAQRQQRLGIGKGGHRVNGMHDRLPDRHEEQTPGIAR